jgi:ribonuclease I
VNPPKRAKKWATLTAAFTGVLFVWFWQRDAGKSRPDDVDHGQSEPAAIQPAPAGAAFDFYLMAMTMHPAFCADGNARRQECRTGGRRPLVIHGLWPERLKPRTYPRDCPVPPLDIEPALALELADLMPGMSDGLHEHEWRTHGGCSGLDDDAYYRHSVALARTVDSALAAKLTTLAGRETTAGELRGVADLFSPGLGRTLTFHCRTLRGGKSPRPYLIEVRQCVDNDGAGGAPRTALACASVKLRDQGCGSSFMIAGAESR